MRYNKFSIIESFSNSKHSQEITLNLMYNAGLGCTKENFEKMRYWKHIQ